MLTQLYLCGFFFFNSPLFSSLNVANTAAINVMERDLLKDVNIH